MSDLPRVSAIIVSYNRSADLRRSIDALFASDYPDLEIIVVDNASSDDAAEVAASYPRVKLVRNADNRGFAEANNQGLALATGDYVALVNNDAVIEESWARELVVFLEAHPEAGAAGGKVFFWNDDNPLGDRTNHYYSYSLIEPATGYAQAFVDTPDEVREVATLSGAVVMIRRRTIEDVGEPFLDPEFFTYYEETDFFARAIRRGWRLYYIATPASWHRLRASTAKQPYRYFYYMERNRILLAYRNLDDRLLARFVKATRQAALGELTRHPLRLLGRGDEAARARRDAWLWALRHRPLLAQHRAKVDRSGPGYDEAVRAVEGRAQYYDHGRPEVVALIPQDARVILDVGCAAGGVGREIRRARPGGSLQVLGIEPVPAQAERARASYDDVLCGTADDPLPASWPAVDCVIFADVLEHLTDPWAVVRRFHDLLAPGGAMVVSLPNVAHRSVVNPLLRGRWDYQDAGILDRTHLRFFTAATAEALLEEAGFEIRRVERVTDVPGGKLGRLIARRVKAAEDRLATGDMIANLYTVQFLLLACKRDG